ncbi:hypothetical protein NE235_36190 [Actinoallomurus spadix]|uniref:Transmembrane protein n=1 Tax=Actinoallomurus spadix TaxID=79912 RepID=A0ABP3GCN2_9ACTN|nr:hypothetical protein [Actinoallomurus spadix]MCO5991569.1 hypothetical protein [Actinoallomurus spadix]
MNLGFRIHGAVRYVCPDRNPLRRRIDRVRSALLLCALAASAFGGPLLAVAVGGATYDSGVGREQAQRLARHRATATVEGVIEAGAPGGSLATLQWRTPAGATRYATVSKAKGDRAGRRRQIWIDRSGALAGPPRTRVQTITTTGVVSVSTLTVAGIGLYGAYALTRRRLDRTGAALWEAEWRDVAPQWTGRT